MWSDMALSDIQGVLATQDTPEHTSMACWELNGRGRGRIKPRRSHPAAQQVRRLTRLSEECVFYLQQQFEEVASNVSAIECA